MYINIGYQKDILKSTNENGKNTVIVAGKSQKAVFGVEIRNGARDKGRHNSRTESGEKDEI